MRLHNKVAIITGAGSGMGRASAAILAKEGAKIVVADVNDTGGKETVAEVKSNGGEAIFIHVDVSSTPDIENLVKKAKGKFSRIDILMNCAGIPQSPTPTESLDETVWERIFAINARGVFLTVKYIVPVMKEMQSGVIINVASMGGVRPTVKGTAYTASKAAVINMTKAFALEFAPYNIRVNCINPVGTDTPMWAQFHTDAVDLNEVKKRTVSNIPLGRLLTPEDIGYSALFLASDEAQMITGICLDVNGGRGAGL
ncbi:SDR family NAD(P)-dependent oxidoreductase [Chloroflexota bacterium]